MPALSIVTVVKDDPAGLDRTLASVADQGSGDAELIIVDGSKQPRSGDLGMPLPTRVVHEPPTGIYPAMNRGLAQAQGRYVYFLNAGDTFADAQVLTRILDGLQAAESPVWAFGAVHFTDREGRDLHERTWDYVEERDQLFARGVFPAHQGVVAQTAIVQELGGFDTRYRIAADYALMLRLSQRADPIRWPWFIADFQQGGASTQHWWVAQQEFHQARRDILRPRGWASVREQQQTAHASLRAAASRVVSSMKP